jgi:glycosyltransferase involved in cell wall biosynthesis
VRVLLVYPYLPYPGVSHGSGRLLVPLLRAWRPHAQVTLVCGYRPHEKGRLEEARTLVHELHPVLRPLRSDLGALGKAAETMRTAFRHLTRRDPIHATKLDRGAVRDAIRGARARARFDVAQVELAGIARCVDDLAGLPAVLVDHEAGVASGGDLRSDPRSLRYIRAIYPRFQRVLALCREDAAELAEAVPGLAIGVRPPGVAVADGPAPPAPSRPTVLFFGSPDHAPNQDALAWLANDLWPRIAKAVPGARCVAIGGVSSPKLTRLVEGAGIENKGFVPDLVAELGQATVVVCPVRSGRGVRMKNLDALAAGRPLVTTTLGARGLDLVDGEHALIADSAADFATAVSRVLTDPKTASHLGAWGRAHVARSFTHEASASANLDLWKGLATA